MSTKNTMKHNAVITMMLLLVLFTFSACASVTPDDLTSKIPILRRMVHQRAVQTMIIQARLSFSMTSGKRLMN